MISVKDHQPEVYVPDTTGSIQPYQVFLTDLVKPLIKPVDCTDNKSDTTPILAQSVFTGHTLRPQNHGPVPKQQPGLGDWIVVILMICLLLTSWIQVFYHKRFRQVFMAMIASRHVNPLLREGNIYGERITVALVIHFVLSYSLFATFIMQRAAPSLLERIHPFTFFLGLVATITSLYFLRFYIMRMTGMVFKNDLRNREYLLNIFIFDMVAGVMILPLMIFYAFSPADIILYVIAVLIFLLYAYRVFRGVVIGLSPGKFSGYHFILYFCTLELLPVLIVIKIVLELTWLEQIIDH
ncbi:MAG: DUF4271 domain-containing protein [Bacteroidetes bacterium]|nr:DUF4271 domain-containing protein [Bacteroidota bacterium]